MEAIKRRSGWHSFRDLGSQLRRSTGESALALSSKYGQHQPAKLKWVIKDCWLYPIGAWGVLFYWSNYRQTLRGSLNWVVLERGPIFPTYHRVGRHHPQQKTPLSGSQAAGNYRARRGHAPTPLRRSAWSIPSAKHTSTGAFGGNLSEPPVRISDSGLPSKKASSSLLTQGPAPPQAEGCLDLFL